MQVMHAAVCRRCSTALAGQNFRRAIDVGVMEAILHAVDEYRDDDAHLEVMNLDA